MKSAVILSGVLILLVVLLAGQSGCSLTQTQGEHQKTYDTIISHDMGTLPDDIDYMLMMDRPTRLSKWLIEY